MLGLLTVALLVGPPPSDAERRVIEYLARNVKEGEPVVASQLYGEVFTGPEERAVLNRLFNIFFKIPLFAAQYQTANGRPPTVEQIAEQFRLEVPGEADVLLRIMDADPRVPRFLHRDPATGEITRVDVGAIVADRRFGRVLERTIAGWEGKPAPSFSATSWDGRSISSGGLEGRPYVVYFWFTGCPPCTQTGPLLARLRKRHASQGLEVIGANADEALEMPVSDEDRKAYVAQLGLDFPLVTMTAAMQEAFGTVSVFPTLFFVDRTGVVVAQLVGFNDEEALEHSAALAAAAP
jgi:thiol-disulfide isomerase/thioredoxin